MTKFLIVILALLLIPIFALMTFIPYWTRKTESFGVSIPEDVFDHQTLKTMRVSYAQMMMIVGIVLLFIYFFVALFFTTDEVMFSIFYSGIIIVYLMISFIIYLRFHKQMKQLKAEQQWTQDKSQQLIIHTKFHDKPLTISHWFYGIPILLSFGMILISIIFYDRFPAEIPLQFDLTGEVTRSAPKSYSTVLGLPITQLVLSFTFLFVNIVIAKAKQQVSASHPDESMQRNIIFRRRWSIFLFITAILITLLFITIQVNIFTPLDQMVMMIMSLVVTFGVIIGAIILSITTGQGGSRISLPSEENPQVIDRDDDQYWKLGQFYFNKDDPTVFLEKRFGIGWTVNWARPAAWLFLIGIIILAVGLPLLLSYK